MPDTETTKPRPIAPLPTNTVTHEQFQQGMERIHRLKDDPEYLAYLDRLFDAAEEYRREIDEQTRRWMDEEEGK